MTKRDSKLCARRGGQHGWRHHLSRDLRFRVVSAIENEGMSGRGAAARFEVEVRTAQHWVEEYRASGEVTPRVRWATRARQSWRRIASWRCWGAEPDITIEGLRHTLAEREIVIGNGSIRRFFAREGITRRKRR